jgi:CcmD family protein
MLKLAINLMMITITIAVAVTCPPSLLAQQVPPPQPDGFVPLDPSAVREQMPAAPLVIAAYGVAWVLLIGYLWSIWRRLAKVQQEIAQVSRRLQSASRPAGGGTGRS